MSLEEGTLKERESTIYFFGLKQYGYRLKAAQSQLSPWMEKDSLQQENKANEQRRTEAAWVEMARKSQIILYDPFEQAVPKAEGFLFA